MHWWKVTHLLVLDRCVTHTIYGVGTEREFGGLLYRGTTMDGYQMYRRNGYNQKVNARNFFLRVTMWSSYKLLGNTLMWRLTSVQMDFWSRFRGSDYQVYMYKNLKYYCSITWWMLPGECYLIAITWWYYLTIFHDMFSTTELCTIIRKEYNCWKNPCTIGIQTNILTAKGGVFPVVE
jgi:hypothetical protein